MHPTHHQNNNPQQKNMQLQINPSNKLIQPKKMFKYEENDLSWDEDCLQSVQNSEQIALPAQKIIVTKPKINHLPLVNLKDRKFSCNNAIGPYRKISIADDPKVIQETSTKPPLQNNGSTQKDTGNISEHPLDNHPPQEQPQSYFNKKMRLLQAKFKKCILQYETQVFKLKEQNKNISHELLFYKNYIEEHAPELKEQIDSKYEQKSSDLMSDSSSDEENKESEQITMPVNAQILQIKIEGRKWFEKIRNLQGELKKASEIVKIGEFSNQNTAETAQVARLNESMRKWSLPRGQDRQKKQSFQTTLISQRSQQDFSQDLTASIRSGVSRDFSNCQQLERSQKFYIQYAK